MQGRPVVGLLIAAGFGRRFDPTGRRVKLEERIDGEMVAVRTARALLAGCDLVVAALRRESTVLTDALAELRDATSHQLHRTDADFMFHRAVTEAANNHYYTASMDALKPHIAVGMHLHGLSLMGPRLQLERVFEEHEKIYRAIADGRAEDARDAMRQHLEGSRDRLFEGRVLDLSISA